MTNPFCLACVQVNARNDLTANIDAAMTMARVADGDGADFIEFPECVVMMEMGRDSVLRAARRECDHPALSAFCDLALDLKIWLLSGTLSILLSDDTIANRSFLIDDLGLVRARYDKIHMSHVRCRS